MATVKINEEGIVICDRYEDGDVVYEIGKINKVTDSNFSLLLLDRENGEEIATLPGFINQESALITLVYISAISGIDPLFDNFHDLEENTVYVPEDWGRKPKEKEVSYEAEADQQKDDPRSQYSPTPTQLKALEEGNLEILKGGGW